MRLHSGLLSAAIALIVVLTSGVRGALSQTATVERFNSPRGVQQTYILIKPDKPVATVVLFAGGHGGLGITSPTAMNWGRGNFLVRSREAFAGHGFAVVVVDAPADQNGRMNAEFRMSGDHAGDIGALAERLKAQGLGPVWLVGTSMGTFSAARGAIAGKAIDGLVLTSTITRAKPEWKIAASHSQGVASMALGGIKVPVLIMSHKADGCAITPAADTPKLKARLSGAKVLDVALLEGGSPPQSDPCEAMSAHGFLGIEGQAVGRIAQFIKAQAR